MGIVTQYKSFESYMINDVLRNIEDITKLSNEQQAFIGLLDKALSKIPTYSGNLVRTVNFSEWSDVEAKTKKYIEGFVPGGNIQIPQYWSTSVRQGYDNDAGILIFIEGAKRGRDIRSIGLDENEVLYERNSEFMVVSKAFVNGKWYILLREV